MSFLSNILFPRFCVGCGAPGIDLCLTCWQKITLAETQRCLVCQKPSFLGYTHKHCQNQKSPLANLSLLLYKDPLKNLIRKSKFMGNERLLIDFLNNLTPVFIERLWLFRRVFGTSFYLVPIPLFSKNLNQRGFNQATTIAFFLAKLFNQPLKKELLFKVKSTPDQATLKKKERLQNLNLVFETVPIIKTIPNNIVLVDDIITTGSTLAQAAGSLFKAGVKNIYTFSLFQA